MKTLFDIGQETDGNNEHTLLLEVGNDYCCTALFNPTANRIDRITYSSFAEMEIVDEIFRLLYPFQKINFNSVVVCSAFSGALLVPTKYYNAENSVLPVVYDLPAQEYLHDTISEWQLVNVYSIPLTVHKQIQQNFSGVQYFHSSTPSIKVYNGFVADTQILVHFTEQQFRVVLKKDSSIQLAQTYSYKTPLDVAYYLLKICYQFALLQEEVYVILSGLVEKESALYTELQQYFTNLHFAQAPQLQHPESPYPHSFFTSIYNLAACVS